MPVDPNALLAAVAAAFADTARDLAPWVDPHPDRSPRDDEYSRVTNPEKWRIAGARADAWAVALVELGVAALEREAAVRWRDPPRTTITRTDRVVPHVTDALPLVLARSELGGVADAGLTVGIGDPAVVITWIPDCGCDACDSGSDDLLEEIDELVTAVVAGGYRHLRRGDHQITLLGDRMSAVGISGRQLDAIVSDPTGWEELTGPTWLPT